MLTRQETAAQDTPRPSGAFDRLFAAEYGRVASIARSVLLDADAAEDVAQEVFAAYARRHRPDAPGAAGWLHAAAVHTALNLMRSERRRRSRETLVHRLDVAGAAQVEPSGDPAAEYEARERRAALRVALQRLRPRYAIVLALRYGGLTYGEIAAALGIGITSVGTTLVRAEAALRKELPHDSRL